MQSKVVRAAAFAAVFALSATASFYANAADLGGGYPPPPPPTAYAPAPVDNWGGVYVGGVLGYGWGEVTFDNKTADVDGILGGALLGWNYQSDRFVVGFEGDLLAAGIDGSTSYSGGTAKAEMDFLGELRARAGFLVMPNLLLFATLGGSWANVDLTDTGGSKSSRTFSGLQYGAGAEVKISPEWSARFDYLYTDYNSRSITFDGNSNVNIDPDVSQVRGSLVYKF